MKSLLILLSILLIINRPIYADIDQKIRAIQHAPAAERYKLMNAFKREIVQMKEHERIEALKKLSHINRSKHAKSVFKELAKHSRRAYSKQYDEHRNAKENLRDSQTAENNNETEENIESNTGDQTEESVEHQTDNQTESNVEDQTDNQTEDNIEHQIQEQTEHETENSNEEEHEDD